MIVCKKYKMFNAEQLENFIKECKFADQILLLEKLIKETFSLDPEKIKDSIRDSTNVIKREKDNKSFDEEQEYCRNMNKLLKDVVSIEESPHSIQIYHRYKVDQIVKNCINFSKEHRMYNTSPLLMTLLIRLIAYSKNISLMTYVYDELLLIPEVKYSLALNIFIFEYLKNKYKNKNSPHLVTFSGILLKQIKKEKDKDSKDKDLKKYHNNLSFWHNSIYYIQFIEDFTTSNSSFQSFLYTLKENSGIKGFNTLTNVKKLLTEMILLINLPTNNDYEKAAVDKEINKLQSEVIDIIENSRVERDKLLLDMKENPDKYFGKKDSKNGNNTEVNDNKANEINTNKTKTNEINTNANEAKTNADETKTNEDKVANHIGNEADRNAGEKI
jgi:hypothetical protein